MPPPLFSCLFPFRSLRPCSPSSLPLYLHSRTGKRPTSNPMSVRLRGGPETVFTLLPPPSSLCCDCNPLLSSAIPPVGEELREKGQRFCPNTDGFLLVSVSPHPTPSFPLASLPLVFHHSWRNLLASRASHLDQHLWTRHLEDFPK